MARCMLTLMCIVRFSHNKRRGLLGTACFSDWLFHLDVPQRRDLRAGVCCFVLRAPILPSFPLRTRKCYITRIVRLYFRGDRTRAIYVRDLQSETMRMTLEAILKIYVHVGLMEFISPGEFLRIRPLCCVLLSWWFMYGVPEKLWFFSTIRVLSVLERE